MSVREGSERVLGTCEGCGFRIDVDLLHRVSYADARGFEVESGTLCWDCLGRYDRVRDVAGTRYQRVLRAF